MASTQATARGYIVTGAAGGIGGALVERLLATGAAVLGVDISQRRLDLLSARTGALPGSFVALRSDVADEATAQAIVARGLECFGTLHGVANIAGGMPHIDAGSMDRPLQDISLDYLRRTFALNVETAFLLCKAIEPAFGARQYGKIVNVASLAAFANRSELGNAAYNPCKAAVVALSQSLSLLLGRSGIRVNCVAPGMVLSERAQGAFDLDYIDRHLAITALGTLATTGDVAEAIAFLLEPASDGITGEVLRVAAGVR